MKIAFCLYTYFPYGGLQRNMLTIASACASRGHRIKVYTCDWQGDIPADFDVELVPAKALSNHRRNVIFSDYVTGALAKDPADVVVGFNKMPGLDLYYAADPCFASKAREDRGWFYRQAPRSRHSMGYERVVFERGGRAHVMLVAAREQAVFQRYYDTEAERFHILPPGIARDRIAPANAADIRAVFRQENGFSEDKKLLLSLGSGFKTKGVDRTLKALAAMPQTLRDRVVLYVVGQDKIEFFARQAKQLGIDEHVIFFPEGRDDVPRLLLGADLLVHPAYRENTGNVLLEAMVSGLPVITTAACGYAHYVADENMGMVMPEPFNQQDFNQSLVALLGQPTDQWCERGKDFAENADIYRRPEFAADIIESLGENK